MSHIYVSNTTKIYPFDLARLREFYPQTSFPKGFQGINLEDYNVYNVTIAQQPPYDPISQIAVAVDPELENGVWTLNWTIENKPLELASRAVRNRRKEKLLESDWTQVADAPVDKQVWAVYRQQLRDITIQPGFPYNITWPEPPQ